MKRSQKECPKNIIEADIFGDFLKSAWQKGWLDEYADNHFLIQAIENRLDDFVGKQQLIENNYNQFNIVQNGKINQEAFCSVFCLNFSATMYGLSQKFSERDMEKFVRNQLSAGKEKYNEDAFFEALSEISILSFMCIHNWTSAKYEPSLNPNAPKKNPEAQFIYETEDEKICVNVEVKSPAFPHTNHEGEKIVIPTILLSKPEGVNKVKEYCRKHNLVYINPRVLKIRDFLNSAKEKFTIPKKNEYNLLYINWSYSDFPSCGFLEAWSLMTNSINGILRNPNYAKYIGVDSEAFKKISAIIVYTESLDGIMFQDFRHIWITDEGCDQYFRMWVNMDLYEPENRNAILNQIFMITGMKPTNYLDQMLMADLKPYNSESSYMANELHNIIQSNALVLDDKNITS